jgi:hypothetical protein
MVPVAFFAHDSSTAVICSFGTGSLPFAPGPFDGDLERDPVRGSIDAFFKGVEAHAPQRTV